MVPCYIPTGFSTSSPALGVVGLFITAGKSCWQWKMEPLWTSLLKKGGIACLCILGFLWRLKEMGIYVRVLCIVKMLLVMCRNVLTNTLPVPEIEMKTCPNFNKNVYILVRLVPHAYTLFFSQTELSPCDRLPVWYIKLSALFNNDKI